jgi:uncharacterized membrane protein
MDKNDKERMSGGQTAGIAIIVIGILPLMIGGLMMMTADSSTLEWQEGNLVEVFHNGDETPGLIVIIIGVIMLIVGGLIAALSKSPENQQINEPNVSSYRSEHNSIENQGGNKFCPFCGANNPSAYNYCVKCKKQLPEK